MAKISNRRKMRLIRHRRVRKTVFGTPERPRLSVFKSNRHLYCQVIDDTSGRTLVSASTLSPEIRGKTTKPSELAELTGKLLAEKALKAGIEAVVFDRGGHKYHGLIKSLADSARKTGLKF